MSNTLATGIEAETTFSTGVATLAALIAIPSKPIVAQAATKPKPITSALAVSIILEEPEANVDELAIEPNETFEEELCFPCKPAKKETS